MQTVITIHTQPHSQLLPNRATTTVTNTAHSFHTMMIPHWMILIRTKRITPTTNSNNISTSIKDSQETDVHNSQFRRQNLDIHLQIQEMNVIVIAVVMWVVLVTVVRVMYRLNMISSLSTLTKHLLLHREIKENLVITFIISLIEITNNMMMKVNMGKVITMRIEVVRFLKSRKTITRMMMCAIIIKVRVK